MVETRQSLDIVYLRSLAEVTAFRRHLEDMLMRSEINPTVLSLVSSDFNLVAISHVWLKYKLDQYGLWAAYLSRLSSECTTSVSRSFSGHVQSGLQ